MSNNLPKLNVCVLGGTSITYGENSISLSRNHTTKAMKLLQILLYNGEKGIAREKLLKELYGREELADAANNLRVTVHRLKNMLIDAGLPQAEYVNIKKGIYQWDAPMETVVDAWEFSQLIEEAEGTKDQKEKIKLLRKACEMYKGDFLTDLSGDDWALIASVQYKNKYTEALKQICNVLMDNGEYEEILKLCEPACEMYPFDEWQAIRIECHIALNKYKEAIKEYEDTAKMFFEELGISPSEKMLEQFEHMSSKVNYKAQALNSIKKHLKEEEDGAYYCNLPGFLDNYRLVSRIIERNGQSVYMMLCSITNGKGQPMENEGKLEVMAQELYATIKYCLRRGDCFTKYSPSQFLILLVGTDMENCAMIYDRIRRYYSREHKSWGQHIEYSVSSVTEIDQGDSPIRFNKDKEDWKPCKKIHVPILVPNITNICVDGSAKGEMAGRIYHCYDEEPWPFASVIRLVGLMEELFDRTILPQASTQARTFDNTKQYNKKELGKIACSQDITSYRGTKGTFIVYVKYRQNSTWQGEVEWIEENKIQQFASVLELLKLLSNALDSKHSE